MLVVFTNKSGSTVDMFEAIALDLIKLMGRRPAVPSAINAEDLPEALNTLKAALAALNTVENDEQEVPDDEDKEESTIKTVGLSTRAHPLMTLMQQTIADESFLMWDFQ